ncbi:MAG TPA: ABC-type transport auxiliary lipoprotein family protein [Candidatus Sulfotelmatobacter sp.]|nr:ABC-type transport auxiliary lipoprotein family protein [Candidatus Sulfotelmatobacter sp.]
MKKAFVRNVILVLAPLAIGLLAAGCLSRPALVRQSFLLPTQPAAAPATRPVGGVLALTSCEVSPPFASQALVYRIGPNAFETDPYAEFLVVPDKTLAIAIRTWLARSGLFSHVAEPGSAAPADQLLQVYVDELYGDLRVPGQPQAVLSLSLVLLDAKKENGTRAIFRKEYSQHLPVTTNTAAAIVAGWDQSLEQIMDEFASDLTTTHKPVARKPSP